MVCQIHAPKPYAAIFICSKVKTFLEKTLKSPIFLQQNSFDPPA
jgi:hypothetical protein